MGKISENTKTIANIGVLEYLVDKVDLDVHQKTNNFLFGKGLLSQPKILRTLGVGEKRGYGETPSQSEGVLLGYHAGDKYLEVSIYKDSIDVYQEYHGGEIRMFDSLDEDEAIRITNEKITKMGLR